MERLIIIDHESHECFIEDVTEQDLEKYNGEEELYIKDNYTFKGAWSWDYVTSVNYINSNGDTFEVEPKDWFED